jgi:integrase/recombinase XerD
MSSLNDRLAEYLRIRRQLGFELKLAGRTLEDFVAFLEQAGAERITTDLAVLWARQPVGANPRYLSMRLGMVRGFARYLATIDPDTEIPATDLLPATVTRNTPYLYCDREIVELMAVAGPLKPALRGATYRTVIGVMASTGIRIGEALGLDRHDIDLDDGVLHLRTAKQGKQRDVPLHETTTDALRQYARLRDRTLPRPETPAFFISSAGVRITTNTFHWNFPRLIAQVEPQDGGQHAHRRPHDLRHTFAVRTLLNWHRAGADVDRSMPLLSTYLGHVNPKSTFWYLQAAPELMQLVAQRLDEALRGNS